MYYRDFTFYELRRYLICEKKILFHICHISHYDIRPDVSSLYILDLIQFIIIY